MDSVGITCSAGKDRGKMVRGQSLVDSKKSLNEPACVCLCVLYVCMPALCAWVCWFVCLGMYTSLHVCVLDC